MKTIQYVAMDVHQASITVVVRSGDGAIRMRAVMETRAHAVVDFIRGLRGAVWVTFEEGTQSQWLHDVLVPHAAKVLVCDPRANRRDGNKGDRVDAEWLSEQLRLGGLSAVYHGSPEVLTLKELVRNYRTWSKIVSGDAAAQGSVSRQGDPGQGSVGLQPGTAERVAGGN